MNSEARVLEDDEATPMTSWCMSVALRGTGSRRRSRTKAKQLS